MKKIFTTALIVIGILISSQVVLAADVTTLSFTPVLGDHLAGAPFTVSAEINPVNEKICVIKGTIEFNNLSCQSITLANGLIAQTIPTCQAPDFTLGIPKCATISQDLFSISVKGDAEGQASLVFNNVKVIGTGIDVDFDLQEGIYNIVATTVNQVTGGTTTQGILGNNSLATGIQTVQSSTSTVSIETRTSTSSTGIETSTSTATATTVKGILSNVATVGSAIFSSAYAWPILVIFIFLCIAYFGFYPKKEELEGKKEDKK